jgi:hypothetical protein
MSCEIAAGVVGPVAQGMSVFAFTMGRFALVDVVDHLLCTTGSADVAFFTWTIGLVEAHLLGTLFERHHVRSMRFVLDYSFSAREAGVWEIMRSRFGVDAVRVTKCHAKLVLIRNDSWNLVVRSSMNLNDCPRLEFVDIDDSPELSAYCWSIVEAYWSKQTADEAADLSPADHVRRFGLELQEFGTPTDIVDQRFYQDGPGVTDLRRVGRSRRA